MISLILPLVGFFLYSQNMSSNWEDSSWQEEFLEMKAHKPSDVKLLIEGPKGLMGAWKLGELHQEYIQLKQYLNKQ